jgi:uncharacterized DUF497 family protein
MAKTRFEWDEQKDAENQRKHGMSFALAQEAFYDPRRVIARDLKHSGAEDRHYCIGEAGGGVLTVRFTLRGGAIRILGAGYWRKGRRVYEQENPLRG